MDTPCDPISPFSLHCLMPATIPPPARPRTISTIAEMQATMRVLRQAGKKVGLVPTMGALHAGHLSLVQAAKRDCDVVVTTIFVNPTQFGPHEDFQKYPRTLENDLDLLASVGGDLVFVPAREEMYPADASTFVDPPQVAEPLEGVCRPGHFRGVATIVLKLFNIIPADVAYFGQKDFQQSLVIRHLVADLNLPIEVVVCPIIREPDALAMSSRNRYLSPAERTPALALSQSLRRATELVAAGEREAARIKAEMSELLANAGIERVEYIAIANPDTLAEVSQIATPVVALIAAFVGTTRLIDNQLLLPGAKSPVPAL